MSIDELKEYWALIFQNPEPSHNREYLISRLAYRIQELAYGGLQPAVLIRLQQVSQELPPVRTVASGTVMVREYHGIEYRVTVLADGHFEMDGQRYRSLSAVARHITGSRWNGPAFFGLRQGGHDAKRST